MEQTKPVEIKQSLLDSVGRLEIYRGGKRMTPTEIIEDAVRLYVEDYDAFGQWADQHAAEMSEEDANGPAI